MLLFGGSFEASKDPPHWDKHWAAAAVPYWAVWGVMDVFLCRRGGRWLQGSAKVQVHSLPRSPPTLSLSLTLSRFSTRCWECSLGSCKGVRRTFLERVLMCRQTMERYVSHTTALSSRCTVGVSLLGVIPDNTGRCLQPTVYGQCDSFRREEKNRTRHFGRIPLSRFLLPMISCPLMDEVLIWTMWPFKYCGWQWWINK